MTEPRLIAVGETTYVARGGDPSPPEASSFYRERGFSLNADFGIESLPAEGLQYGLNLGIGPNYRATQISGLRIDAPLDFHQFYVGYRRGLFYMDAGRRDGPMAFYTIRPVTNHPITGALDPRDFTRPDPAWSNVPFTDLSVRAGVITDKASLLFSVGPGPDLLSDNNGSPYFFTNFTWTQSSHFYLFGNYQVGASQQNNNTHMRHSADLGLTFEGEGYRVQLYGVVRRDRLLTGALQVWHGENIYFRFRPQGSPLALVVRAGYSHFDWDNINFAAGLNCYLLHETLRVSAQIDTNHAVDAQRPFHSQASEIVGTLQLAYTLSN